MTIFRKTGTGLAVAALLATTGCITDPNTGNKVASRTALGAGVGALGGLLLGDLIGGKTGRIVGAGIGGIAGGVVGSKMDEQIKQLKNQTAGTGVEVKPADDGRAILVSLPDGVTFDTGSYLLQPQFRPTLDKIAGTLKDYPDSLIDVYGHTDSVGAAAYNQTLSDNRARTVGDYLTTHNVAAGRIRTQGFGFTQPVADNAMPEGRAKNRRVEIKIVPITQEQVQAARTQGGV
jgi:outer membrane protein OmpA-like peptidoglycan-associated protein